MDDERPKQAFIFKTEKKNSSDLEFEVDIKTEKTMFVVSSLHFLKEFGRTIFRALVGAKLELSFFRAAATSLALNYINKG